jgi:hypothetical protein
LRLQRYCVKLALVLQRETPVAAQLNAPVPRKWRQTGLPKSPPPPRLCLSLVLHTRCDPVTSQRDHHAREPEWLIKLCIGAIRSGGEKSPRTVRQNIARSYHTRDQPGSPERRTKSVLI